ncbi:MAG: glycosyltransferase family 4 protein [Xanthobacteraceae bacterium]|nr:glycosyltransferase family 4 protein [Xanthobacteraceae bacterium]
MKLLYCYYYANLGGVTSVIKSRLPALKKAGIEVAAYFEKDFGGVADLQAHGLSDVRVVSPIEQALPSILRDLQPDLAVAFDMPELVKPLKEAGKRVVLEIHTPILTTLLKTKTGTLELCDQIVVPSEWSREWVRESLPGNYARDAIVVVPNMINRAVFRPAAYQRDPARIPLLLWVGKIANYKRWKDAIRVAALVRKDTACDLVMVTGGDCSAGLTEEFLGELSHNGLKDRVKWLHNVPLEDMASLYRRCRASSGVLLSTSEAESFCLVIHEGMSCGVPVVAAAAGALPELLTGDLKSQMFFPGDVGAAAACVRRLLRNEEAWEHASASGITRQKAFSPSKLAATYIQSVRRVLLDAEAPA